MKFDLFLAGVVVIFGLFGLLSGAMSQFEHWLGLIVAAIVSRPLAAKIEPYVASWIGLSPLLARVILSGLLFIVLYLLVASTADQVLQVLFPDRQGGRADGLLGFVLGAAKGAALLFILLSFVIFFEKPLTKTFGAPPAALRASRAIAYVRRHDLFGIFPVPALNEVEKLIESTKNPRALQELEKDPQLRPLLEDPRMKAALRNASPR